MEQNDAQLSPRWYVLNHIAVSPRMTAQRAVDAYNAAGGGGLSLFAPTYVVSERRDGETHVRTAPLTFHYVFVRGTLPEVKALCALPNGFSFLINRGSEDRYATVDERTMAAFRAIANAYRNCLPYYSLDDIELEDGDLVEVVRGDFPGLVGRYMPNPRSRTGNVVLSIYNNVGTVVFNVKATDVRVLEFSRRTTRANDQIDAFVPHLLEALRLHHGGEALPAPLAAKLGVFAGRMALARVANRKLDARLQLLLHAAAALTGDRATADAALERYRALEPAVTNVWTRALASLTLAVLAGDVSPLSRLREGLPEPASRAQRALLAALADF